MLNADHGPFLLSLFKMPMSVIKIEKWPAVETFSMKLVHGKKCWYVFKRVRVRIRVRIVLN